MATLFRILWMVTLLARARTLFITKGARRLALETIVAVGACGAALVLAWGTFGLFVVLALLALAGNPNLWTAAGICGAVSLVSFCLAAVVVLLVRRTEVWAFVRQLSATRPSPR
jgi:hypothetical protein